MRAIPLASVEVGFGRKRSERLGRVHPATYRPVRIFGPASPPDPEIGRVAASHGGVAEHLTQPSTGRSEETRMAPASYRRVKIPAGPQPRWAAERRMPRSSTTKVDPGQVLD